VRKTTWLFLIIIALLIFVSVYLAIPQVKATTNKNVLGPIASAAGGTAAAIYANPIWKTYVVPYQFVWGVALMGFFAIIWWKLLASRAPTIRKPSLKTTPNLGSTGLRATTPPGATLRPETTTPITPTSPIVEPTAEKTEEPTPP